MTVADIKDAILHLSDPERNELLDWLAQIEDDDDWDRQMKEDFAPGGRGRFLLDEAQADIDSGRTMPLAEFLDEVKAKLSQPSQ